MTIVQLRYFHAVYRLKSVTAAARELFVSQPSVSSAIRELEEELGVQLFYRVRMRLTPTEEGKYFYQESEAILQGVDRLTRQMQELGEKHDIIRIGIPPMVGALLFPRIFSYFRQTNPGVRIEAAEYGSLMCREKLLDESLDLAIVITNDIDSSKFETLPLMDTELWFCVGRENPLAVRERVRLEDIRDVPIALLPEGSFNRRQVFDFYRHGGCEPNILLHSSQLYTIEQLLCRGDVGTFMFSEYVRRIGAIQGIPLDPAPEIIHIGVAWKRDKHLYSDVIRFLDFVRAAYKEEKPPG